jgi:hypothetical protein
MADCYYVFAIITNDNAEVCNVLSVEIANIEELRPLE